ncbi:MAG: hypothetical protein QNJ09_06985 [Paracoccaceae bacterium]|nr:hypothetical protein [Paracoccaceae bacterium]
METYNFWSDLFDTYQSLSDWLQLAWLVVPPAFLLGVLALVIHYRLAAKRSIEMNTGSLAYTVFSDENGILRVYTHDGGCALTDGEGADALLPLPDAHPRALAKPPSSDL